jgi:formate hydrogenlyase transcriptional activator
MKVLQSRQWPGNIREVENVVERALIASRGARFEIRDEAVVATGTGAAGPGEQPGFRSLAQIEHDHILGALERVEWRIEGEGGAADALGINASTLRSRMRKHGIRRPGRL